MLSDGSIIFKASSFGVKQIVGVVLVRRKKTTIKPGETPHCMVTVHPGFWGTVPETRLSSCFLIFLIFSYLPDSIV